MMGGFDWSVDWLILFDGTGVGRLVEGLLLAAYFSTLSALAVYGVHRYYLVYLYFRHRRRSARPPAPPADLPKIAVQLPVYNEKYVVERLIDSVVRLNYPRRLLHIQVLDDSDDETARLAERSVRTHAERGVLIDYVRRPVREGFKAGALRRGLETSDAELVAVFDADFVPHPDSLLQMLPFFADPAVGMVQLRWTHLNRDYSLLTKAQAVLLDGHFVLESETRCRSGRFFNFNGTAGMWRRRTIEDAGGWQHDTLTEDLDLSYRAQLRGWKFVFLPNATAPAEVPVDMNSFKSQQYRWAKGSVQTGLKLLPRIVASRLPLRVKTEAFFHLSANLAYPLMVVLGVLTLPVLLIRLNHGGVGSWPLDLFLFAAATLSVSSFYFIAQKEACSDWKKRILHLPVAMALGIGLSVSNTKAVAEALLGVPTPFMRTPKFGIEKRSDEWRKKHYRAQTNMLPALEVLLGLYCLCSTLLAVFSGLYVTSGFLGLIMAGHLLTGVFSLLQGAAQT